MYVWITIDSPTPFFGVTVDSIGRQSLTTPGVKSPTLERSLDAMATLVALGLTCTFGISARQGCRPRILLLLLLLLCTLIKLSPRTT